MEFWEHLISVKLLRFASQALRRLVCRFTTKQFFQWFSEDHSEAAHRYQYREWFTNVGQQSRLTGNEQPFSQIRGAASETLTEAEKSDPELAAVLAAYREPAGRGGRGRGPQGRGLGSATTLNEFASLRTPTRSCRIQTPKQKRNSYAI